MSDLIVTKKKKTKSGEIKVTESMIEAAKNLSKQERKREEQIIVSVLYLKYL